MNWLWGIPAIMVIFAGLVMWAAARSCSRSDRLLDHIEIEREPEQWIPPKDRIGPKRKGEPQGAVHMYTPRRGRHLGIYTEGDGTNGLARGSRSAKAKP